MKVAVVGSRDIVIKNLKGFLPLNTTEIVSGGAKGVDSCAADYAKKNDLSLKVFLPEYKKYGKSAPLKRNIEIIDYSDIVIAFWNGVSKGTKFVIDKCNEKGKEIRVIKITE